MSENNLLDKKGSFKYDLSKSIHNQILSPEEICKLRMHCKHNKTTICKHKMALVPVKYGSDMHTMLGGRETNIRCEICGAYIDNITTELQYLRMVCDHEKPDNSTAFVDQNGELRCDICGVYKDKKGRIYIYEDED